MKLLEIRLLRPWRKFKRRRYVMLMRVKQPVGVKQGTNFVFGPCQEAEAEGETTVVFADDDALSGVLNLTAAEAGTKSLYLSLVNGLT
jgi:hypothetical protein